MAATNRLKGILYSYSQVFFAKNLTFSIILLIVSFFDWWMGLTGLLSVIIANLTALVMGFDEKKINSGIYGFNPLLVGLGVGLFFSPAWQVLVFVFFASVMTLFVSLVLEGVMAKYALPYLSLPFLFSIWLISLSFGLLTKFGLNPKDIYEANELFSIGGLKLVNANEWLQNLSYPAGLKIYFQSIGAIFFQFNIFAGIIISIGLLIYSRQGFLMSLIGFYTAFAFYNFIGVDTASLSVSYYGFNFILSAIALGSYFLVPSFSSLLYTILAIPILSIITISTDQLFSNLYLSVYSLPFNIVVLGFIYALKLRTKFSPSLREVPFQQGNAESNAYFYKKDKLLNEFFYLDFNLPIIGRWKINQAFDGEYTHKDAWRYAWDFVVADANDKEFRNTGDYPEDYYCYNKPVIAIADGTVVEVIDGIEDNIIGQINVKQNWGNTVVIYHGYGVYSQYSHLKAGTIKVGKGLIVKKGQIIANVGNSGRSPYPHLHFQFQISYLVGSKTLKIPFSNYLVHSDGKDRFVPKSYPELNQHVSNIQVNYNIARILKIVPGNVFDVEMTKNGKTNKHIIEANIDIFNNAYLSDNQDNKFYFENTGEIFKAVNFYGKRNSLLYYMYLSLYFIPLSFYKDIEFHSNIPVHKTFSGLHKIIQDFLVNFGIYLRTNYKITAKEIDNELNPSKITYTIRIENKIFNKNVSNHYLTLILSQSEFSVIQYKRKNKKIELKWKKRQR